jgi:alpha-mannosidase/mannosylglycerate hydrolase
MQHTLHIVSHTHWDREWYQPFVGYQRRLVFAMDRLLELLETDSGFRAFYLDGQTCMLDDYLAIRPEKEAVIRKHLQSGRLGMGPWHVMPDELLVSGEALVRNLEKGVKRCAEFGCAAVPLLHASDVFGHCSQMPQIMRGFCIDKTMLLRGTSAENEQSEMLWTGADGTKVWILKVFPDTGYCDIWTYRREENPDKLRAYEARKIELATTPVLIGLDGNDHQAPFGPITETIQRMEEAFQNTEVMHSSMTEALAELDKHLDLEQPGIRRKFTGELRTAAKTGMWNEVFFGTASARVPTKQKNDLAQLLLSRVAEPLHALASLRGGDPDRKFLDLAWEYLLKCHPHDSIVGCSTDQIDRDVHYRLDQAIELARDGAGEALYFVAARRAANSRDSSAIGQLFVFNPSTSPAGPVVDVEVEVPHDPGSMNPIPPVLKDTGGNVIASSLQLVIRDTFPSPIGRRIEGGDYPRYGCRAHETATVDRWKGVAQLNLPPMGQAILEVHPGEVKRAKSQLVADSGVRAVKEEALLENEFLTVSVNPDASFNLKDKQSGKSYCNLGRFEFQHDRGNGWDFKPIDEAGHSRTAGAFPTVRSVRLRFIERDGLRVSLVVSGQLRVPAGLNTANSRALKRQVTIAFKHTLSLDSGAKFLNICTRLNNKARDFRLRLLFPTGLQTDNWWSDSAYDVVKRPIQLPDTTGWKEQARPETPIHNFAAICDNSNGLAVVTHGLQEACVLDSPERLIALTLLRCYSQKIGSGRTEATQQQGPFAATFHIGPFTPENSAPPFGLLQDVDRHKLPLQCLTLATGEAGEAMDGGEMPSGPCLDLSGKLLLSAFYRETDRIIVRVWNPTQAPQRGSIRCRLANIQSARPANLAGQTEGPAVALTDGRLDLHLPAKAIQTWVFEL